MRFNDESWIQMIKQIQHFLIIFPNIGVILLHQESNSNRDFQNIMTIFLVSRIDMFSIYHRA